MTWLSNAEATKVGGPNLKRCDLWRVLGSLGILAGFCSSFLLLRVVGELDLNEQILQSPIVVPIRPALICSSSLQRLSPLFYRLFCLGFLTVSCLPFGFLILQTLTELLHLSDPGIEFAQEFIAAFQCIHEPVPYRARMERPFWLVNLV